MKLAFLKNVKCVYNVNTTRFDFSWTLTNEIIVHKVVIVEISSDSAKEINPASIVIADASPSYASYKPNSSFFVHDFLVVGVQDYDANEINLRLGQRYRNLDPTMSKLYTGFSGSGTVLWKDTYQDTDNKNGKIVTLQIKNPFDVPIGFLCYSYEFCSVRFSYTVYKKIEKNDTLKSFISFYIPSGANGLKLEMPGTSVEFMKMKNSTSNNKSFFSDMRKKLNGLFGSRESKNELL